MKGEYRNSTQVVSQEEFLYREKIKISILCIQFPRSCTIYHYVEVSCKFINRNLVLVSTGFCPTLFDEHDRLTRHVQSEIARSRNFPSIPRKEGRKEKKKKEMEVDKGARVQ